MRGAGSPTIRTGIRTDAHGAKERYGLCMTALHGPFFAAPLRFGRKQGSPMKTGLKIYSEKNEIIYKHLGEYLRENGVFCSNDSIFQFKI